jgi:hypothetical protein
MCIAFINMTTRISAQLKGVDRLKLIHLSIHWLGTKYNQQTTKIFDCMYKSVHGIKQ